MIQLNPFAISGILISITCFFLGFILLKYGKTKLHKIWALFNFVVGVWGIGCIFIANNTEDTALLSWRISLPGYFISVIFYHTAVVFSQKRENAVVFIGYVYAIAFYLLNFFLLGNNNFAIFTFVFNSFYYIKSTSWLYHLMLFIWMLYVILGHIELWQYYRKVTGELRNKTLYFFWGVLIGFLGGTPNLFPMFGINIYPWGNFAIPVYIAIVTYALLKHKLMDINIVFRKSLIYSFLVAVITVIYLVTVLIFEQAFKGLLGYKSFLISIFFASITAFLFIPLKNKIQSFVDKYFFKGTQTQIVEENERLRQELARAERLKATSTLASGLAHEVKNPLTALKTFSEYLPQKLDDKEFLKNFSRIVLSEVDRIDSLVHQLLDFAKPSPVSLKQTNIHQLIDDTINFLSSQLINKKIEVKKEFSMDNLTFNIDPNQIRQALLNIFLNAIDAMPNGGILMVGVRVKGLGDRDKNLTPNPYTLSPNSSLEIIIQDTGTGINPKDLPHIFDPFFSKKEGGTGLGLAVTHQIIQEHKGKIKVESRVGEGTKFKIELPRV